MGSGFFPSGETSQSMEDRWSVCIAKPWLEQLHACTIELQAIIGSGFFRSGETDESIEDRWCVCVAKQMNIP